MSANRLKPLAMGELIDQSATFWRSHLKALFLLYLPFELALYALSKAAMLGGAKALPLLSMPKLLEATRSPQNAPELLREAAIASLGLAALLVLDLAVTWWVQVAGTRYCVAALTGEPATLRESVRLATRRTGRTLLAFALSLGQWGVAAVVCAAPGLALIYASYRLALGGAAGAQLAAVAGILLTALGILVSWLWYLLRFLLTAQVLASEDISARAALRRSNALVSGRIGDGVLQRVKIRATILLTVVLLIRLLVSALASVPGVVISAVYTARGGLAAVPQAAMTPAELLDAVAGAATGPLYLVFTALFYVDMRMRREGLDLELELARAQKESP